jgi:hypothetical protein
LFRRVLKSAAVALRATDAVRAYEAVGGTKVMDVAADAVVAYEALTDEPPPPPFKANDAVRAYEALVGVNVMLVAAEEVRA